MISYSDACLLQLALQQAVRDRPVDPGLERDMWPVRFLAIWAVCLAVVVGGLATLTQHIA
jgi:hypothetical protein